MSDLAKYVWIGIFAAVLFCAIFALCGVLFAFVTWNLGVVGLAAACGWTVAKIGFWTGVGGSFVLTSLGGIFHGYNFRQNKE